MTMDLDEHPPVREYLLDATPGEVLVSARRFQVWAYSVSHSQLLLRSNRSENAATRIDLAFRGVVAMDLIWTMDDLRIDLAPSADLSDWKATRGAQFDEQRRLYSCKSANYSGWVIASTLSVCEDGGRFDEPSQVFEPWLIGKL